MTQSELLFISRSYLSQPFTAARKVDKLVAKINLLRDEATTIRSVSYDPSGNMICGTQRFDGAYIEKLDKLESELKKSVSRWIQLTRGVSNELDQLPDSPERSVLYLRYICEMSLDQVREHLSNKDETYSYRHIVRLHQQGLETFFYAYLDTTDDINEGGENYEE